MSHPAADAAGSPAYFFSFSFSSFSIGFLTGWRKNGWPDFLSAVSLAAASSASALRGYSYSCTIWCELLNTPQTIRMRTTFGVRARDGRGAFGLAGAFFFL